MALSADQLKRLHRLRRRHLPAAIHHRYSRFVRVMKITLPSLAVVLLALVVVWPRLSFDDASFRLGFASLSPESVKTLSMINARYFGIDQNAHPYTVTSDNATQRDTEPDIIDLQVPKADFTSKSGANVFVEADRGYYHQKDQLLDLAGHVSLYHENGTELHTEEAHVDLKTNDAHGEVPVHGQGVEGLLEGEGFVMTDKGADILVTGHSALTLKGASGKGGGGTPPQPKNTAKSQPAPKKTTPTRPAGTPERGGAQHQAGGQ